MANKKLQWIKFRIADWLLDENVRVMSLAARGLYHDLLLYQAQEGSIPDDPVLCARIVSADRSDVEAVWSEVRERFDVIDVGRIANPKMTEARSEALAFSASLSERGSRGGKARAEAVAQARLEPSLKHGSTQYNTIHSDTALKSNMDHDPRLVNSSSLRADEQREKEGEPAVEIGESSPPALIDTALEGPDSAARARKPRQQTLGLSAGDHAGAAKILEAAWAIVFEQNPDIAISQRGWKTRNKAAAVDLHRVGKTPAQVVAALRTAYRHPTARERGLHTIAYLHILAEKWTILSGIAQGTIKPFGASAVPEKKSPYAGVERA
jgi:hypothetical protein